MSTYGALEVEYYQLTPLGVQRGTSGGPLPQLDPQTKQVLLKMVKLGGTAEVDELKFMDPYDSPLTLRVGLKRLMDLGYVTPVTMESRGEGVEQK